MPDITERNIDKFEYNGITYNLVDNTVNKGTVRNVTLTGTAPLTVTDNSSNTETINKTISLANGYGDTKNPYGSKNAKLILATPNGQAGTPSFRQLVKSDISDFPTSLPASDVSSWAKQSTKPTYALTEITGTDDLQSIEALTGTSGLLKKTAANTWTLDTNSYAPADNYVTGISINQGTPATPTNGIVDLTITGGGTGVSTSQQNTSDNVNYGILLTNNAYAQTTDTSGIIHKTANLTFNPNTGSNTGLLTLTGDAVISGITTTKLDTAAINGYVMDDYGNFLHKRSNANDCFNLKNYGTDGTDRETTLKMYYDSGNVLTSGIIAAGSSISSGQRVTITPNAVSIYNSTSTSSSSGNIDIDFDRAKKLRDLGNSYIKNATTSLASSTSYKNMTNFTISGLGMWLITVAARFQGNSSGRRSVCLSQTSGSAYNYTSAPYLYTRHTSNVAPVNGAMTVTHFSVPIYVSKQTTFYVGAYQNSGSALNTYVSCTYTYLGQGSTTPSE